MKSNKLLPLLSYLGIGILALAFVYNLLFGIFSASAPAMTVNIVVLFLPIMVALLLVPYGLKKENKNLIYFGNMMGVVSASILSYQLARLCYTTTPGLIIVLVGVWPFALLAGSLTIMAYAKKVDFTPIHVILTFVALAGVVGSLITNTVFSIVFSVRLSSGIPFGEYISIGLAFIAMAPVAFLIFALKGQARLVKLEVPEWVKPVKPAPAPKAEPALEPKVEAPEEKPAVEEPAENKEEAPKA